MRVLKLDIAYLDPGRDLFDRATVAQDNRRCGNLLVLWNVLFKNTADLRGTCSISYTDVIDIGRDAANYDSLYVFTGCIL